MWRAPSRLSGGAVRIWPHGGKCSSGKTRGSRLIPISVQVLAQSFTLLINFPEPQFLYLLRGDQDSHLRVVSNRDIAHVASSTETVTS